LTFLHVNSLTAGAMASAPKFAVRSREFCQLALYFSDAANSVQVHKIIKAQR